MFLILFITLYVTNHQYSHKENKYLLDSQAFTKPSTLASSGVKENLYPINMLVLWKIVFLIKLFYLEFYFIIFYLI